MDEFGVVWCIGNRDTFCLFVSCSIFTPIMRQIQYLSSISFMIINKRTSRMKGYAFPFEMTKSHESFSWQHFEARVKKKNESNGNLRDVFHQMCDFVRA